MTGVVALGKTTLAYRSLEDLISRRPTAQTYDRATDSQRWASARELRAGFLDVGRQTLLRPYAWVLMTFTLDTEDSFVAQKRRELEPAMRFAPTGVQVEFEVVLLARSGDQAQARRMLECYVWAYPGEFERFRDELRQLAAREPARFADLVEFGSAKFADYQSALNKK